MNGPTVLGERFRVDDLIGSGGFARVYDGVDLRHGAPVAIKVMRVRWRGDARVGGQFLDESLALRRLSGLSIPELHAEGQTEDRLRYLVMDRLDGHSLGDLLDVELRFDELLASFRALLTALDQIHARGVVHGDLKANNVLIAAGSRTDVRLIDFGLARVAEEVAHRDRRSPSVGGTPEFMAPELTRGAARSVASDIYAAGAIFYEMLTGGPPFTGASSDDIAIRHRHDAVVPPSTLTAMEIVRALDAIVVRALAKRPADRFRRAADLCAALEPIARIATATGAVRQKFTRGSDLPTWRNATPVRDVDGAITQR